MQLKRRIGISVLCFIGLFISACPYFNQWVLHKQLSNRSCLEPDYVVAKNMFIDWHPEYGEWVCRPYFSVKDRQYIYKKKLAIDQNEYEVYIDLNGFEGRRVGGSRLRPLRPAIFGDLVKYKGHNVYGIENPRVYAISIDQAIQSGFLDIN